MDEHPINNEKLTTKTFKLIVDNSTSLKETFLVYWYTGIRMKTNYGSVSKLKNTMKTE